MVVAIVIVVELVVVESKDHMVLLAQDFFIFTQAYYLFFLR